jgi:hypothetical protein
MRMRISSIAVAVAAAGLIAVIGGCGSSQPSASVTLCHDYFAWIDKINFNHYDKAAAHKMAMEYLHLAKDTKVVIRHSVGKVIIYDALMESDTGAQMIEDQITATRNATTARAACNKIGVKH